MAATGELDAIVTATERATSEILNAAERLGELAPRLRQAGQAEIAELIDAQVTEILMACSFQDITGQRTTKVVNTLRYIEQRVKTMVEIWGVAETGTASHSHRRPDDMREDAHLLNGPALSGGMVQDDVDALLDQMASGATMPSAEPVPS